jgi:uncharacterized membrane protein
MSSKLHHNARRGEEHVQKWMGALLRGGVILAAILVLSGGVVYLARHSGAAPDYHAFRGEPAELRAISGISRQALAGSGPGLIQAGLLILIATPIARVAFSVLAFLYQRDWIYVLLTLIVLGLLGYSLLGPNG